jgi:hypothetical protein
MSGIYHREGAGVDEPCLCDRYIHANYRFIVDPRGDYHVQTEDADVHLDWANVLQVVASSQSQTASCPICLGEPTAPRMAKCGHIFCLSCLIRYMHSEDASTASSTTHSASPEKRPRWKKCPICYDSIYISETKPVRMYAGQESPVPPTEGSDIVLRLVKRKAHSTLAMPRENVDATISSDDVPWFFAAEVMDYARVMKGSEEYMLAQYDEALEAVQEQHREDELMFGEDDEWTNRAVRMLLEAKEKTRGIGNPPKTMIRKLEAASTNGTSSEQQPPYSSPTDEGNTHESSADEPAIPRTIHDLHARQQAEKPPPSEYLFYHSLPHAYLSPLDIRVLKTHFGSYTTFPTALLPRIERVSTGHVVDDDLRRKCKYLSHLPRGCEVSFLECDWSDVVSEAVLAEYAPVLDRRRKRWQDKVSREEKERLRIERDAEREVSAMRGRGVGRRPGDDDDGFFSAVDPNLLPHSPGGSASSWSHAAAAGAGGNSLLPITPRPGFTSLASPSTSPNLGRRTVWGTAAVAPDSGTEDWAAAAITNPRSGMNDDDGWLQGWEKDLLLELDSPSGGGVAGGGELVVDGDGAVRRLDEISGGDFGAVVVEKGFSGAGGKGGKNHSSGGGGGKKGKKGKKITLMSTGGARRGA